MTLHVAILCSTQQTLTSSDGTYWGHVVARIDLMYNRWDDDVVFKNQARGTEDKKPKEFVNDLLRSDFHKRFMVRCIPAVRSEASR